MGIFEKLTGGNNSEIEKWAVFVRLGMTLANTDGSISRDEAVFSSDFIIKKGNLSDADVQKVIKRSQEIENQFEIINSFTDEEKTDLIMYLIELSGSDGEFHGKEFVFIIALVGAMGTSAQAIADVIFSMEGIDLGELEKAYLETIKDNPQMTWPHISFKK